MGDVHDGGTLLLACILAGRRIDAADCIEPSLKLAARRLINGRLLTALG